MFDIINFVDGMTLKLIRIKHNFQMDFVLSVECFV